MSKAFRYTLHSAKYWRDLEPPIYATPATLKQAWRSQDELRDSELWSEADGARTVLQPLNQEPILAYYVELDTGEVWDSAAKAVKT